MLINITLIYVVGVMLAWIKNILRIIIKTIWIKNKIKIIRFKIKKCELKAK